MGSFSVFHWLIVLVGFGVPVAQLLHRLGLSRWWTIVAFVPLLNVAGLWYLAFGRLPRVEAGARRF